MSPVFDTSEYRTRLHAAQTEMARTGLAALLLTTEPDIRYFTGFLTRFWESPTRPWFLLVPASGDPVAVIPSIGAHLMGQSWISDIRTWAAPNYDDDGVSLLAEACAEFAAPASKIGVPSGLETHLRMPLASWQQLCASLPNHHFTQDSGIMQRLRAVKSEAEIEAIRATCAIATRAFSRVPEIAGAGVPLSDVFRRFQILCLEEGADWVAYLAGGAGQGGYGDVISPASDQPLARGDVMMLDTGLVRNGYFCDFDRNFSIGPPRPGTQTAHAILIEATQAGFEAARIGATPADLFHTMDRVLTGGQSGAEAGRFGHGLGMQLTEGVSLIPDDHTELQAGMVLTLEPSITLSQGQIMVHEENIVIRESGAEWLSQPAKAEMIVI